MERYHVNKKGLYKKGIKHFITKKRPTKFTMDKDQLYLSKFNEAQLKKYEKAYIKSMTDTNNPEIARHAAIRYVRQRKMSKEMLDNLAKARQQIKHHNIEDHQKPMEINFEHHKIEKILDKIEDLEKKEEKEIKEIKHNEEKKKHKAPKKEKKSMYV